MAKKAVSEKAIDTSGYHVADLEDTATTTPARAEDPLVDVQAYLAGVDVPVLQRKALGKLHAGKILPRSEWQEIIGAALTKRVK